MKYIVSGVETLDTFSNSDVVNVCTRLLNEATTTRMNLHEAVQQFRRDISMLNRQVRRYMQDPTLDDEEKKAYLSEANEYAWSLQHGLVQYSKEYYSDEPPNIVGEDE
jgi:hypothetical protein